MTQGTIGVPITPGVGTGIAIAAPLPATWLSLHRYSGIVNVVSPPHFFGSHGSTIFPITGSCDAVVPRHGWQLPDTVSREEILDEILLAEQELSEFMGFHLAPTFVEDEMHKYPKPYDPILTGSYGLAIDNTELTVRAKGGHAIQPGVRKVTLVGTATTGGGGLQYLDRDGDGVIDTAEITLATTETSTCGLKAYVSDTDGEPEWEIRHPRSKVISGGFVVFEFDVWLFINPDIDGAFLGTDSWRAIDYSDTDNLLPSVDIYLEEVDYTQPSVRFFWEEATCEDDRGAQVYQDGVLIVSDVELGYTIPRPATYNSTTGKWDHTAWTAGKDPDQVRLAYYAGHVSQNFLRGRTCDPLEENFARAIAYIATARLTRSICSCPGVLRFFELLQEDLALALPEKRYGISFKDLENPFGTRMGEVMAWRLLGKVSNERQYDTAVI